MPRCRFVAYGSWRYRSSTAWYVRRLPSIKAFMSRTTDRFRPPFGKRVVECPRQCVFSGTVNHTEYLRDETGARRFWPVLCGSIDIDALARDRDQLWAEAKHRYSSGEKWWLDTSALVEIAAEEQAARYQGDPWEEIIGPWLASSYEHVHFGSSSRSA